MSDHGWHLSLEMQMDYHRWLVGRDGERYTRLFTMDFYNHLTQELRQITTDKLYDHMVSTLWRGDNCYVTSDMQRLIEAAADSMPEEITLHQHDLLCNTGFLIFEDGLDLIDRHGKIFFVKGFMWDHTIVLHADTETDEIWDKPEVQLYFLCDLENERDSYSQYILEKSRESRNMSFSRIHVGHFLQIPCDGETAQEIATKEGDSEEEKHTYHAVRTFLAFNMISREQIVSREKLVPPRATRKRAVKWDRHGDRYISLITLRRRSVKKDEQQTVDWTHRWVVTGHWRKQWYPKERVHRWKYIPEYIKGPDDKPLLIRERRVFNLER